MKTVSYSVSPWPVLMRARTAAAYVDEASISSFRRRVGTLYPRPIKIAGRGEFGGYGTTSTSQSISCLLEWTRSGTLRKCSEAMRKPTNWPRYMLAKRLRDGRVAYYWDPRTRDLKSGCTMRREAMGTDYATAIDRASLLNKHLDSRRQGRDAPKDLDHAPDFGSLRWLVER